MPPCVTFFMIVSENRQNRISGGRTEINIPQKYTGMFAIRSVTLWNKYNPVANVG